MVRSSILLGLSILAAAPYSVFACKCSTSLSPCNEVQSSELVFIGTVESIQPMFLSRWNTMSPADMRAMNQAYNAARQDPSATTVDRLRDSYLKAFPELTPEEKARVQAATTLAGVTAAFYSSLYRGMRVRFHVKTLFKHEDDDGPKELTNDVTHKPVKDDDGDDRRTQSAKSAIATKPGANKSAVSSNARRGAVADKDADKNVKAKDGDKGDNEEFFEIETPFDDCAIDFQEGETYLVYANGDEDSGVLSTTSCTRTRRLSDAGEDLAYLFFFKDRPEESSRLDGLVTSEPLYRIETDPHNANAVRAPAEGAVVELQSGGLQRYTETDPQGQFVFDGLRGGDYSLSVFSHEYPLKTDLLAGPQSVHVNAKSCATQLLQVIPKTN